MNLPQESTEIAIIGAGPIGLACGIEAKQAGVSCVLFEKGCLLNSIYNYPANVIFFSTPERLELGSIPFITAAPKPTRVELLRYYTRVAQEYALDIRLYERITTVAPKQGKFWLRSSRGREILANKVIVASGFYDHPNYLGIPGENLPKVSHYYKEAHPYFKQKVAIIGGQNSAVEAALEIFRAGAEKVTLVHRRPKLGDGIKYWVLPDIENRIQEGSIQAFLQARVIEISEPWIRIRKEDGTEIELENDFVLALTGYHPDFDFLRNLGIELDGTQFRPLHDSSTMESSVPGMYVAGVVVGGLDGNKIFIENGREHARLIMRDISRKLRRNS